MSSTPTHRIRRALALVAVAALALTACGSDTDSADGGDGEVAADGGDSSADGSSEFPYAGYERNPPPEVGDLALPAVEADDSSTDFGFRAADDGELLLVYFGYTSCPDVCPTTLSDIRLALDDLGGSAEQVDLAMVTIDPEIDTAEVLTGYVQSFVPDATAIRTESDDDLREVATVFGVDYGVEEVDGEREVFHTGSLYAVDSAGELVLTWPFGVAQEDLEADIQQLLDTVA